MLKLGSVVLNVSNVDDTARSGRKHSTSRYGAGPMTGRWRSRVLEAAQSSPSTFGTARTSTSTRRTLTIRQQR